MRKTFFVPIETLRNIGFGKELHKTIYFVITVSDERTLITKQYNGTFEYTKDNIKIEILSTHKYYSPGVPYTAIVSYHLIIYNVIISNKNIL